MAATVGVRTLSSASKNWGLKRFSKIELQTGMTFILKPQVRTAQDKGRASIGDTVTVTENGARRLGKRELKLIVIDA